MSNYMIILIHKYSLIVYNELILKYNKINHDDLSKITDMRSQLRYSIDNKNIDIALDMIEKISKIISKYSLIIARESNFI